jgi:hypothetical protein
MPSTITGNLGGASASGVQITCYSQQPEVGYERRLSNF